MANSVMAMLKEAQDLIEGVNKQGDNPELVKASSLITKTQIEVEAVSRRLMEALAINTNGAVGK